MGASQVLKASETSALERREFLINISGKKAKSAKRGWSFGATSFITTMIVVFLVFFNSGNLIPSALSERLVEETDMQYADAVESKKIVFQVALESGEIPEDTARILKSNGVLVGYLNGGTFIESNKNSGGLVIKIDNKIVAADDFVNEVSSNVKLYDAFNKATYGRAAYYYDESAKAVFKKIGTSRDNYREDSDFEEVMEKMIGSGSNINVNSVSLVEKKRKNQQTGEEEIYYDYEENGSTANSKLEARDFIGKVNQKNLAPSETGATLSSANTLKVTDTISKEQRSSLFFLSFMENISKMKAGEGNNTKINEAMNYLHERVETEIVDVKTGQVIKTTGTALESPSLYAILSGEKISADKVENYSSDRIVKTIKNQLDVADNLIINDVVVSTSNKINGSIGRFVNNGGVYPAENAMNVVEPTINSSLVNNSYETIKGVDAGELLVEGAINVGKELAKASGATAGDAMATTEYIHFHDDVLAMDAKVDRTNRSPFDITSRNTFLGSIVYKTAKIFAKNSGMKLLGIGTFSNLISQSIVSLLPVSYADEIAGYLNTYGDCQTLTAIGAVGSAQCSEIATFDTSTLDDPFHNSEFIDFVNTNTTLEASGIRTINQNSKLSQFILYNNERITPLGVVDGGILNSLSNGSSSVPFITNILEMVKNYMGASELNKKTATGAIYVNSNYNEDWQVYKYAQRYVSLARATAVLRQYAGDSTAYNNIKFFEGSENPVVAFLQDYYAKK